LISIGNDIVSLQCINPERTRHERFFSKILAAKETDLYENDNFKRISFENFVWLAWSAKEAIYKLRKRYDPALLFSPVKISIRSIEDPLPGNTPIPLGRHEGVSFNKEECYCCTADFGEDIFYTRSFVTDTFIFTVAGSIDCFDNVYWGIKEIGDDSYIKQSHEVRAFALDKLRKIFLHDDVSIEKTDFGYPVISREKNIPLSFSHHGKFVGYTFVKN